MVKRSGADSGKGRTEVISFRIATDLHAILTKEAAKHRDEAGLPLNASGMARKLLVGLLLDPDKFKKSQNQP